LAPGPHRTRYRVILNGWDEIAHGPPIAARRAAPANPATARDQPGDRRLLPTARHQRPDICEAGRTRLSGNPESRIGNHPSSMPSVALEMLGRDASGPALAGKAERRSEGGRGQVVAAAVVLGASPAGPDGHHLEADEAPPLPVEA